MAKLSDRDAKAAPEGAREAKISVGGAEFQVTVTVDGLDADLMLLTVTHHRQLDSDPGLPAAP